MLQHTFLHIPGIGPKTEARLWAAGVHTWQDFISSAPLGWRHAQRERIGAALKASRAHLDGRNPTYFAAALPAGQHWRLFAAFRDNCAYLDIETTGLAAGDGAITTIAVYDGTTLRTYVQGRNLDTFVDDIRRYPLLITYNGKCFDLPFIERSLGVAMPQAHIDLRYVLAAVGLTGGLKSCEKRLGLDRGELQGVDGLFAVLLWREYRRTGNPRALETLLAYNCEDTLNLEHLMVAAYNLQIARTPFAGDLLPAPDPAPRRLNRYRPDRRLLQRLSKEHAFLSSLDP